jgi:exonuclease SbcD
MKFIHAADLHIDSPLRGLDAHRGAPVDRLRLATREAMANLVDLALSEAVDFLIIAGDLFDGKWLDARTGVWTRRQFQRLHDAGISVYMLRGNHDAASKVQQAITWPDSVHEFSVDGPQTFLIEELGVALHGQGFATPSVTDDLAANYPSARPGLLNIGVLHTSLTGDPDHDNYAATSVDTLVSKGYEYWALGHIHDRRQIHTSPHIAYSGNTQGRHARELGAKGCLLVSVVDGHIHDVEFRPTDTLRWHVADVELAFDDGSDELLEKVEQRLIACHAASEGRFSAIRVVVRGASEAHRSLDSQGKREELIDEIRQMAYRLHDEIWIEKVQLATKPPLDMEQLRGSNDLIGELLQMIQEYSESDEALKSLAAEFAPLETKATLELSQADIDLQDPRQLRQWLEQAETTLVSLMWEANSED